jgi:hypothetical protein
MKIHDWEKKRDGVKLYFFNYQIWLTIKNKTKKAHVNGFTMSNKQMYNSFF